MDSVFLFYLKTQQNKKTKKAKETKQEKRIFVNGIWWYRLQICSVYFWLLDRVVIETVAQRCCVKKLFLEISENSSKNTCARVSVLLKLQGWNFIKKETLAQVFSCEFLRTHCLTGHLRWQVLSQISPGCSYEFNLVYVQREKSQ